MPFKARILSTGSYLPPKVITNDDLAQFIETSDEWIIQRTGILQRHIAAEGETTADLGEKAARAALKDAGVDIKDIDLIILATSTPNNTFPATSVEIQHRLGMDHGAAFDVQAVCSGFVYALSTADMFIRAGKCRNALIVGTEIYSNIIDWNDRTTCVLFGDGAGAVVLSQSEQPGILSSHLHANGNYNSVLSVPGSISHGKIQGNPYVSMEGNTVFKFAVTVLEEVAREAITENNLETSDIDWLIPHQANIRIIKSTAKKLGIPMDKVVATVDMHGNTSAASIPLALDIAVRDGRIQSDQLVLLEGVGGGFTWGAVLLRWGSQ